MEKSLSRRAFLQASGALLGNGLMLAAGPTVALADAFDNQPGFYAAATGKKINPYSVTMSGAHTMSKISDPYFCFELRRAIYNNAYWLWLRGTVYQGTNNVFGGLNKLVTPYGTVNDGMIYGYGDNWTVGGQRCTPAICIGMPKTTISVTYYGSTYAGDYVRTIQIPAESIVRMAESGA